MKTLSGLIHPNLQGQEQLRNKHDEYIALHILVNLTTHLLMLVIIVNQHINMQLTIAAPFVLNKL